MLTVYPFNGIAIQCWGAFFPEILLNALNVQKFIIVPAQIV